MSNGQRQTFRSSKPPDCGASGLRALAPSQAPDNRHRRGGTEDDLVEFLLPGASPVRGGTPFFQNP